MADVVIACLGLGKRPIRVLVRKRATVRSLFLAGVDEAVMPTGGAFSNRPLYLQVRDALAELIARGAWKPGSSVLNENDLARELGVSSGTIRKALELLVAERLIVRRQGRGTFVADPIAKAARLDNLCGPDGERVRWRPRVVEIAAGTATAIERARLQLHGDDIYRIRRIAECGDRIWMVEDATVPAALFPGLPDRKDLAHDITLLALEYGVLLGRAEERISLAAPPADVADILRVRSGSPVMVLDRVVYRFDGIRPLEWRLGYSHPEQAHYMARLS